MLSQLFETTPDALIVVDGNGLIVKANHNAERLFGYPEGGLADVQLEALMPKGARERHHAHRINYMANPRIRPMGDSNMALTGQRLDGQQFPIEIALSPLESNEGRRFLASVRDVSESQRARQAVVRARYDALAARIGQLALESPDESGVLAALPGMLANALGIPEVAVAGFSQDGQRAIVLASVGVDNTSKAAKARDSLLWRVLEEGKPVLVEHHGRHSSSLDNWPGFSESEASLAIMPLLGRDRTMGALVAASSEAMRFDHDAQHLLRSVANLVSALLQRRQTEEQLAHSQRLDAIGQLTGGIAHDFNNLLTVVSGNLQLLELEFGERPEARELIGSALRSVSRGSELTSKLLAFARKQRLKPLAVGAATLFHEIELLLRGTLGEKHRLRVECAPCTPIVFADSTQLEAALVNLALNARDAMPEGGDIRMEATECWVPASQSGPELDAGHYVVLSVEDSGCGMPPAVVARAIEPFFSTKPLGHGTGLGLSMVYGFVRQSGGYLRLKSEVSIGTKVEMYFPVAETADAQPAVAVASQNRITGERVLVVEDDPEVRKLAAAMVRSLGYEVETAESGETALQMLRANGDFEILFSDVMLGEGMDGLELARIAIDLHPGLAVLLTSGYEDRRQTNNSQQAFVLLPKPYRREQLSEALRRELDPAADDDGAN